MDLDVVGALALPHLPRCRHPMCAQDTIAETTSSRCRCEMREGPPRARCIKVESKVRDCKTAVMHALAAGSELSGPHRTSRPADPEMTLLTMRFSRCDAYFTSPSSRSMSTPTIELNTVPRAIPRDLQRALTSLIASSKLILLTGAGISTRANIPDFRSHDGLYAQGKGKKKAKDLFSADVFRSPEATEEFFRFTASMQRLTSQAEPTVTHKLAKKLAKTGKLLRCYTQNIDALEVKAGLAYATAVKEGHVVQLHGNVHRVRCACGWQGECTKEVTDDFAEGDAAPCPACDDRGALMSSSLHWGSAESRAQHASAKWRASDRSA